ncbi:MAG: AraC family transcriptional regulator [Oscillospiraceae bacterium]
MYECNVIYDEENFKYDFSNSSASPNVPPHFHNGYEILNFQKGDAVYKVEGKKYELSAGDILITNPREMHCPIFKSNNEYRRSIIFLKPPFLSDFITNEYNPFSSLENRKIGTQNKIDTDIVKKYELDKKMNEIGMYTQSDLPEREIMIKTHMIQFLVLINNIVSIKDRSICSDKVNSIIQYINEKISEKITLDELANEFYLNKYHISHLFKERMGITIVDYVAHKRIALAKELILEEVPLGEISSLVGFTDYSNFYRSFVKITGKAPSKICRK